MRLIPPLATTAIFVVVAACHSTPAPTPSSPVATPQSTPPVSPPTVPTFERGITPRLAPPLPAIPLVDGPLAIAVAFPDSGQSIAVRDSNYIFGSVGTGHATLTINGALVPVAPNGTFLAYLPVPGPDSARYDLVARNGTDSVLATIPVRVPPPRPDLALDGPLVVDSSSVAPGETILDLRNDEPVRVSVRAPENATAWVSGRRLKQPLVHLGGTTFATDVSAGALRTGATLYVSRGRDTVRFTLARPGSRDDSSRVFVSLGDAAAQRDSDATIIARPIPDGTYKWMFLPGTIVQTTGRENNNIRVRLDGGLEVWVDSENVRTLPAGYPSPRRVVGAMSLVPAADWVDLVMPVSSPPPYLIEQDLHRITLTLYGTQATPAIIKFLQNDSLVRMVNWVPERSDRVRLSLELTRAPYGYLVLFEPGRGLVLRLRRPPPVSLARPLQGLVIAVDAGHPPGGAVSPTRLTEPEGVLPVAMRLKALLEERGARVIMTRSTPEPVDLHLRSVLARQANANALISIHLNAFGDGVDPAPHVGTSTLFFHPQSEPMARLIQAGMMREMGLRDLGVHYQNIAIGRTSWMPAVICEGAFLMMPASAYALTVPAFQERYARGVADGVEAYFRSLAQP